MLWTGLQNNVHNKREWSTVSWSTTRCYLLSSWCMQSISSMFYLAATVVSLAASVSRPLFGGLSFALMGSRPIENFCCASFFCPFLFFSIYSTASFVHWNVVFYSPALRGLLLLNDRRQLQEPFFTGLSGRLHVSTPTYRPPILTSVSVGLRLWCMPFSPQLLLRAAVVCGKRKQDIFQRKLVIWWRTQQRPLGRRTRSCSVGQVLAASL